MAILKVSYSELSRASVNASNSARRLEDYSSRLSTGIANKINNISGGLSEHTRSALSITNKKIKELNDKSANLYNFSKEIEVFEEKVRDTDKSLAKTINSESKIFAKKNNMKINKVYAFFQWLGTGELNKTALGRWVKDTYNKVDNQLNDWKTNIKHWMRTGGGEYIKDIVFSVLGVAAGVLGVIAAIASGGALIFVIAGLVASLFLIANGVNNIVQSSKAYKANKNGDPSWAKVYGNLDKASDSIRFHLKLDWLGDTLDLVEGTANVIVISKGITEVFKLFTKPGKAHGFASLKKLFGSQNNKRSVGILGTKFKESVGQTKKFTGNSIKNGMTAIFKDSKFRGEVGSSIKLFGKELLDIAKHKKMTLSQGKELLKKAINGNSVEQARAISVLQSTIKNETKTFSQRSFTAFKEKFITLEGISDVAKAISMKDSFISIREFVVPNIDKVIASVEDLIDEINGTKEEIVAN